MSNFWKKLNKPILALAPMAGITDSPFRQICRRFGADVLYSEMASATALVYAPAKTLELLQFTSEERPYVVQLFGGEPAHFGPAVEIIEREIKPDGIDINFGCPVKKVVKQGAGAALFSDLKKARQTLEIVAAKTNLPLSIKIRTQAGEIDALHFLKTMADLPLAAVMIHGRTYAQGFAGEIDYEIIQKAKETFSGLVLANGGITDRQSAEATLAKTGADGLGLARGALGRPWLFREIRDGDFQISQAEIYNLILDHARLMLENKGEAGIAEMRKHLCWYFQGWPGAKKLREQAVTVSSLADIERILQ